MTITTVIFCFVRTMTNWQSWNIWENSLHILQKVRERGWVNITVIIFLTTPRALLTRSVTVTCVPVLQVFGFDLSHLAAGEVKHLLTEELQDDHVVLTQALTGATRTHDVTDECGPVLRPLLLQDLHTNRNTVSHTPSQNPGDKNSWNDAHLHQDHVELCYVNPLFL